MENQKVLANINLIKETINKAMVESIDSKLKKSIEIIAISKKQPLERLVAALNANHKIFGENKEAISNIQEIHNCRMTLRGLESLTDKLNFPARARWPLDENAPFMKGAGVKL